MLTYDQLKNQTQEKLIDTAFAEKNNNQCGLIAQAMIYASLKDLDCNSDKKAISNALKQLLFFDTNDAKLIGIIDGFAGKIKNRMVDGKTPQKAFEDIKDYKPNWFMKFIYWCGEKLFGIVTEISLRNSMNSLNLGNRLQTSLANIESILSLEAIVYHVNGKTPQEAKESLQKAFGPAFKPGQIDEFVNSLSKEAGAVQATMQDVKAGYLNDALYKTIDNAWIQKNPEAHLLRSCLFGNKSNWIKIQDVGQIEIMKTPEGVKWHVKTHNNLQSLKSKVSLAAMMRYYLGKNNTTEYVIVDNAVASKSVEDSMTLDAYIKQEESKDTIDENKLATFKANLMTEYPDLFKVYTKKDGKQCFVHSLTLNEIDDEKFKIVNKSDKTAIQQLINSLNTEDIKWLYKSLQFLSTKYVDYIIESMISVIDQKISSKIPQRLPNGRWYDIITKSVKLPSEGKLDDKTKGDIREFCKQNQNKLIVACIQSQGELMVDDLVASEAIIECLGGASSDLMKKYIKLQLANFKCDGHVNNILVKLDTNNKIEDLVGIDCNTTDSETRKKQFNLVLKLLNNTNPGLVQQIEEEFENQIKKPQSLHKLAELLGAKEEEYKKLHDKDVDAATFQGYVKNALNRGPIIGH